MLRNQHMKRNKSDVLQSLGLEFTCFHIKQIFPIKRTDFHKSNFEGLNTCQHTVLLTLITISITT
jgi:hypothetical protein